MRLLLLVLLLGVTSVGYAQSSKKKKKNSSPEQASPTSIDPNSSSSAYAPKKSKSNTKKSFGATHDSERDFYERREEVAKTKRKNERMMEKPQYSDPTYFGHKRPPKKRPANKMKFCKECGIRH